MYKTGAIPLPRFAKNLIDLPKRRRLQRKDCCTLSDRAEIVAPSTPHCVIVRPMNEMLCSTPGCSRRVPADSKVHRIVLHDPGTRVLGVLYYCSPCLEHFASYGLHGHFAPRYESTPTTSHQSMAEWSAWVDQLLEEDI